MVLDPTSKRERKKYVSISIKVNVLQGGVAGTITGVLAVVNLGMVCIYVETNQNNR